MIDATVRITAIAIIPFQVIAAASWRRVRAVTRTSAAAAICSEVARRPSSARAPRSGVVQVVLHRPGMTSSGAASSGGTPQRRVAIGGLALGRAGAIPASSASVACTRRRSCSTQRGQLRRWTSSRRPSRSPSAPSSRSEIRPSARSHQPLPGSGLSVWRSSLRAAASASASSLARRRAPRRPRRAGGRRARTSARARASSARARAGRRRPRARPSPDRPDRRVGRALGAAVRAPSARQQ